MMHHRALDGLRGLCAVMVCLFHFKAAGPLSASPLLRGSWLCVDIFFVLSGFVIAAGWGGRLERPADLPRFLLLRLARVWPLHMVMLCLFLATEFAGAALSGLGIMHRPAFGPGHGPDDWLAAALLLNCFGLTHGPAWNVPAWSIAAEYWSWAIFGLAWVLGGRQRPWLILLLALLAWMAMLADGGGLNRSWDGGLWRALCGFFAGVLVQAAPRWQPASAAQATRAELAALALAIGFMAASPPAPFDLAAPPLFALVLWVMAADAGWCSRGLGQPVLQRLGQLSCSVYLVHGFVQARLGDALDLLPRLWPGLPALSLHTPGQELFGRSAGEGLALTALMLALVIAAALLANRWVEMPVRAWARRRWHPVRAAVTAAP
jgi:peptidoglycan/LPS O-acetylase OafA/YrhL